jgi:hypothetical protein
MGRPRTTGRFVQHIARKIADGAWLPGQAIPPARQLAISYGVARATIDATLRDAIASGLLVSQPRRAVFVAADARRIAAELLAKCRDANRPIHVAVITPAPAESTVATDDMEIVRHVTALAHKRHWKAEQVYWPLGRRGGFPRLLSDRNFDGAFCVVSHPERIMALNYMREREFPLVVYNRRFFDLPLPTVMLDSYGAVQRLGATLLGLGHRRITLLVAVSDLLGRFDSPLITGWLDFCRQHDLADHWDEPVQVIAHPRPDRALRRFLTRRPLPSALIIGSSVLAEAFLQLAPELNLRLPDDISVAAACSVGTQCCADIEPHLTCIRPNIERVAECSLELLARMIAGEPYPPPIRLPHTIVHSDSIGPPPHR